MQGWNTGKPLDATIDPLTRSVPHILAPLPRNILFAYISARTKHFCTILAVRDTPQTALYNFQYTTSIFDVI